MVRSLVSLRYLFVCLFAAISLLGVSAAQAHALDIYDDGGIGTTYTTYFQDILDKYPVVPDYVYFRSGQYQYVLVVSDDLEFNEGVFTAPSYDYFLISTSNNYGSGYLTLFKLSGTDLNVNVGDNLVYSSLGHFPSLVERGSIYDYAIALILVIGGSCVLLRSVFAFVLRLRSSR